MSISIIGAGNVGMALTQAFTQHGETVVLDQPLRDGDRVELLRPLLLDPKEARRRRAGK